MYLNQLVPTLYEDESDEAVFNRTLYDSRFSTRSGFKQMMMGMEVRVKFSNIIVHPVFGEDKKIVVMDISIDKIQANFRQPIYRNGIGPHKGTPIGTWFPFGFMLTAADVAHREWVRHQIGYITEIQWDPFKRGWGVHFKDPEKLSIYHRLMETMYKHGAMSKAKKKKRK